MEAGGEAGAGVGVGSGANFSVDAGSGVATASATGPADTSFVVSGAALDAASVFSVPVNLEIFSASVIRPNQPDAPVSVALSSAPSFTVAAVAAAGLSTLATGFSGSGTGSGVGVI